MSNNGLVSTIFWSSLDNLLESSGKNLKQFCEEMNVSYGSMRATRSKGLAPTSLDLIINIAKYFNVPIDYLLTGNKSQLPDDVLDVCFKLCKLTEEQRQPVIKLIEGQIDFWNNTFNNK